MPWPRRMPLLALDTVEISSDVQRLQFPVLLQFIQKRGNFIVDI